MSDIEITPLAPGSKLTIVVTGANIGCGYECCKQLAAADEVGKIIVGCRSASKCDATIDSLVKETGKERDFFGSVVADMADLVSIAAAVETFPEFDRLCLNAGGLAPSTMHAPSGVTQTIAINALGPAALVDGLLAAGKVRDGARIVNIGSEVSRTIVSFTGLKPNYCGVSKKDVDWLISHNYQACFCNMLPIRGQLGDYTNSKIVSQLHFAHVAKQNPKLYVISTSPGAVGGSFAVRAKFPVKQLMGCVPCAFRCMLVTHACSPKESTRIGVKRYVDVLTGPEVFPTGSMPMSGAPPPCCCCFWGAYGPMVDNRPMVSYLKDEALAEEVCAKMRACEDAWAKSTGVAMKMVRS